MLLMFDIPCRTPDSMLMDVKLLVRCRRLIKLVMLVMLLMHLWNERLKVENVNRWRTVENVDQVQRYET